LAISRGIGDRQDEASHLGNLGQIQLELAYIQFQKKKRSKARYAIQKAENYFQEAIEIARRIRDRQIEGRLCASLGLIQLRNQMFVGYTHQAMTEAIKYFRSAIAIAQEIGDQRGEASHLGSLGGAYELMGSMNVSLPPFVGGSPYPGEDANRHERYKKELQQANEQSFLEAYEYYSHALYVASEIGDEQMSERLKDDRARVGAKARLPLHSSSGEINMNIWMRNQKPPYTAHPPGTRYMYQKPAADKS
jgi:tetratricopeptide (TPR) repeat protein